MSSRQDNDRLRDRQAPVNLDADEFRALGHRLVDDLAAFFESLPQRPVTPGRSPGEIRARINADAPLPIAGTAPEALLTETAQLLFDLSVHNGHPRFWGYITSSAAPLGALADLLAASVNANQGRWDVSPVATEIESQTIRWLAELVGFPTDCGGLMVSGGNMANFLAFIAARRARADWDVRTQGLKGGERLLTCYGSADTHTWIEKAADVAGLGTDSIRWIDVDAEQRVDPVKLERRILDDKAAGHLPFIVVATAGTTATGAIDPLPEVAALCREHGIWFHVDGAYGAPAAALPDAPAALTALRDADSLALDPHKWLYSPLEAGCVLVRDADRLADAFSFQPSFYHVDSRFDEPVIDYYTLGMQNSRGFRALKVWLSLRHVGRDGYLQMMQQDIELARHLYACVEAHPELEACTQHLSITTFRYRPDDADEDQLDALNRRLVAELQQGGEVFVSNAIVDGRYLLRACVVNFRTTLGDIEALPDIVVTAGRRIAKSLSGEPGK